MKRERLYTQRSGSNLIDEILCDKKYLTQELQQLLKSKKTTMSE